MKSCEKCEFFPDATAEERSCRAPVPFWADGCRWVKANDGYDCEAFTKKPQA